jgi:hypothetical protein
MKLSNREQRRQKRGVYAGPSQTVPKHGKSNENRLYNRWRRGPGRRKDDGSSNINPDGNIRVMAVCGSQAALFDHVRHSVRRRVSSWNEYGSHGQAVQIAMDHDGRERVARARRQGAALND